MYKRQIWKDGEVKGAKERTVAVKKLHALPAGAEPIREFCKEVVLMQRMDHRNLLPLLGIWMPPDGSFAMVPRTSAQFGAIRRNSLTASTRFYR